VVLAIERAAVSPTANCGSMSSVGLLIPLTVAAIATPIQAVIAVPPPAQHAAEDVSKRVKATLMFLAEPHRAEKR
jgi:hypothetical protein